MIKVVYGHKGIGKTKYLITSANNLLQECSGDIVYINHDDSLVTNLKHKIRYVNIKDFPITTLTELYSFICGLIAQNYDINTIFVDGLAKFDVKQEDYPHFFDKIKFISEKYSTNFVFSISGDISGIPEYVTKEYSI
ncbi:MAG: hypothetical protein GX184_03185 [Clostridiaceae bacterium]|nr:hypothetical protein [Clostridiaceae bacterium]